MRRTGSSHTYQVRGRGLGAGPEITAAWRIAPNCSAPVQILAAISVPAFGAGNQNPSRVCLVLGALGMHPRASASVLGGCKGEGVLSSCS